MDQEHVVDAELTEETALVVKRADVPALPDISRMRANMALVKERRQLLREYVQSEMSLDRHFYNPKELGMGDDRNRLNQEGARNLQGLYEVYADNIIEDTKDDDGHIDVTVRTRLVGVASGQVVSTGTGFCSTRESKYAYRWVAEKYVPKHLDKARLRSKAGKYGMSYRVPNDDLGDVYHTVRQMAVKRAEVHATCKLPGVTELFAPEDEDKSGSDAPLDALRDWLKSVSAPQRDAVVSKLFNGKKQTDLGKLGVDELSAYLDLVTSLTENGVNWKSGTLLEDIKKVFVQQGETAKAELFG